MLRVKGSLQKHLSWWQSNVKNNYIIDVVKEGYKLPLLQVPQPSFIHNNKSARDNPDFVNEEINRLLESGVIIKMEQKPTVVNALSVATNILGKHRLVLDLRNVNPLMNVAKLKYESITAASNYFINNGFMITFDLKSGYHHIDIHRAYIQYLGFQWNGQYFCYTTCPFGLSVAGLIFSKVLRELVLIWRSQGLGIVMYLDDGLLSCETFKETEQAVKIIHADLTNAGFIINEQKSCWVPCQKVTWLGFTLDARNNIFLVPEEKLSRLRHKLAKNLAYASHCSAREIARSVGTIESMYHAFGPIVHLMTKECTRWVEDRTNWNNRAELPQSVILEIRFWLNNLL
jgi:hypothetical protein